MPEKKQSQRCRERFIRESRALQKNLEKRKRQLAERAEIKQDKQNQDSEKEVKNG